MKVGASVAEDKETTVYKPFIDMKMPTDVRDVSLDRVRVSSRSIDQKPFNVDGKLSKNNIKNGLILIISTP